MSTENTENTPEQDLAELSKPEDVTEFIEQRREDEAADRPAEDEVDTTLRELRENHPELKEAKKLNRYQRKARATERWKQEALELRAKYEPSESQSETETQAPEAAWIETAKSVDQAKLQASLDAAEHMHGEGAFENAYQAFFEHVARTGDQAVYQRVMTSADQGSELVQWWNEQGNPSPSPEAYEAAMQQGRQQQEFQQQREAEIAEIRVQEGARLRSEAFAAQCPDFVETVQSLDGFVDDFPPLMIDLMRRSPVGPELVYLMAKDFWSPNSMNILEQARETANDPLAQAQFVGALEQVILTNRSKGGLGVAQRGATKAPPPLSPVRGGASPPRDLHGLAKSDDASDYIRARRSAQ